MIQNILLLVVIAIIIFLVHFLLGVRKFAPWLPAFQKDMTRIFRLANLQEGETFYDLGCGDGRVVVFAAQHTPAHAIGVEVFFPLFFVCKLRQWMSRNKQIVFKNKNLFEEDLSRADVVYLYGMPSTLVHLVKEKLQKELKPGSRVISYVFKIDGLTPSVVDKPSPKDCSVYLYNF